MIEQGSAEVLAPLKDVFSNSTWNSPNPLQRPQKHKWTQKKSPVFAGFHCSRVCAEQKAFCQRSSEWFQNMRAGSELTSLRQQSWQQTAAVPFVRIKQPCLTWTFKVWFSTNKSGALLSVMPCEHLWAQVSLYNSFWTKEPIQEWRKSSEVHLTQTACTQLMWPWIQA